MALLPASLKKDRLNGYEKDPLLQLCMDRLGIEKTGERLREEKFNPDFRFCLREDWQECCQRAKSVIILFVLGGFFGSLNRLLGPEQLRIACFDQPDLVDEILDYLLKFWVQL